MVVDFELKDSHVLVSGAGRGIGLAIVEGFLLHEAKVLAVDIQKTQELDELKKKFPNQLVIMEIDLMNDKSIDLLLKTACEWDVNLSLIHI